jgi:hypothetical protein
LAVFLNLLAGAALMAGPPSLFSSSFVWLATFAGTQFVLAGYAWTAALSALAARDALARIA